jgi:hypothetical protein
MKAFAVWLSVPVALISLTSAFVPSSPFANPGPFLTKRMTHFYSTTEDDDSVIERVASIFSGSEDDTMSVPELKLVFNTLEKLRGSRVKEIHDYVVEDSDADADEFVGTQTIVEELDAPGQVVTPEALAEVAPALEASEKNTPQNSIIDLLYNVIKVLLESRIGDFEDEMSYDTYPRHAEVSKTSSSLSVKGILLCN